MPLETGTTIEELNELWPLGTDPKAQGDDHLRLIKAVVKGDAISVDRMVNDQETELDARYAKQSEVGPQEIVEADHTAGWQVWGDILIQWGTASANSGSVINPAFPIEFASAPRVTAQWQGSSAGTAYHATASGVTTTNFALRLFDQNANRVTATCSWIAVGEAPDSGPGSKKPKIVQTLGNTALQEFHDPAGVASWQIVGSRLTCWGSSSTSAGPGALTFPKTFLNPPTVSLVHANVVSGVSVVMAVQQGTKTTTGMTADARRNDSGAGASVAYDWIATGEWDGVS